MSFECIANCKLHYTGQVVGESARLLERSLEGKQYQLEPKRQWTANTKLGQGRITYKATTV